MYIKILHVITCFVHVAPLWCRDGHHLHFAGEEAKAQRGWGLLAKLPSGDYRQYESRGWTTAIHCTTSLNLCYFGDFPKLTSLEGNSQGQRAWFILKLMMRIARLFSRISVYFHRQRVQGFISPESKSLKPWYGTSNLSLCLPSCVTNIGCS